MALIFIANLILCYALVKIVVLTGWTTFRVDPWLAPYAALAL